MSIVVNEQLVKEICIIYNEQRLNGTIVNRQIKKVLKILL